MALTAQDRNLLRRCLNHESGAWNDFIDRYLGLIYHVIQHTAHLRSHFLQPEETEDIAADIMEEIAAKDYAVLRQFRGNSSLASFLTVIARRICVTDLTRRHPVRETQVHTGNNSDDAHPEKEARGLSRQAADSKRWKRSANCSRNCRPANARSCSSISSKADRMRKSAPN